MAAAVRRVVVKKIIAIGIVGDQLQSHFQESLDVPSITIFIPREHEYHFFFIGGGGEGAAWRGRIMIGGACGSGRRRVMVTCSSLQ